MEPSTVGKVMLEGLPAAHFITVKSRSYNQKSFVVNGKFGDFPRSYGTVDPNRKAIDYFLTPDRDVDLVADDVLNSKDPFPQVPTVVELIKTEGDVVRDFHRNLSLPIQLFWMQPDGVVRHREQATWYPEGFNPQQRSVDYAALTYVKERDLASSTQKYKTIGIMRRPGSIEADYWTKPSSAGIDAQTIGLQRELRAYASVYECPQIFLYDSLHLVLVQSKATKADDIKKESCDIELCVIARENPLMRYALWLLTWAGQRRLGAERSKDVTLYGWQRKHDPWCGAIYWQRQPEDGVTDSPRTRHHPNGYKLNEKLEWVNGDRETGEVVASDFFGN